MSAQTKSPGSVAQKLLSRLISFQVIETKTVPPSENCMSYQTNQMTEILVELELCSLMFVSPRQPGLRKWLNPTRITPKPVMLLLRRDKDVKICKVKSSTDVMLSPLDYKFLTVIFSW